MKRLIFNFYFQFFIILVALTAIESTSYGTILLCNDVFKLIRFENLKAQNLVEVSIELSVDKIYVNGSAQSDNLIFMSASEYSAAVKADQIPVGAILVLDRIPLIDDLPLVSAIIVGKKLELEDTHIQIQAQKMGIVLIYSPNIFNNNDLRILASNKKSFEFRSDTKNGIVIGRETQFVKSLRPQSILPTDFMRKIPTLIMPSVKIPPRYESGDKFFSLAQFKLVFPNSVPDITSLSSDYFETFLDSFESRAVSLRDLRQKLISDLDKANLTNNENEIKRLLEEFRNDIKGSQPINSNENIFDKISATLKKYYLKNWWSIYKQGFSGRSNNGEEDLLGAGLYKSAVISSLETSDIDLSLREIWSSLYAYRAYTIRRYWGQQETHLSMPVMMHPFVGNVQAHAVGNFTIDPETGNLEFTVNMVMGNNEKATNPSDRAETLNLTVSKFGSKNIQLTENSSNLKAVDETIKNSLMQFFNEVEPFILSEFKERRFTPPSINIEFVIPKKTLLKPSARVLVLQYKPTLDQETMISILKGETQRSETDIKTQSINQQRIFLAGRSDKVLVSNIPYRLDQLNSNQIQFLKAKLMDHWYFKNIRYALMTENNTSFFIIWIGQKHVPMKSALLASSTSDLTWVKSGYLEVLNPPNGQQTLVFSQTTLINNGFERSPDLSIDISQSKIIFKDAWNLTVTNNKELADSLYQNGFLKLKFITHQGSDIMNFR